MNAKPVNLRHKILSSQPPIYDKCLARSPLSLRNPVHSERQSAWPYLVEYECDPNLGPALASIGPYIS